MAGKYLKRGAIVDVIKSEERTNSVRRRSGLADHPVQFTACGCPDPACGGWHTIDLERTLPKEEECAAILKADNKARKSRRGRT